MDRKIIEIVTHANVRTFFAQIEGNTPISFSRHYDRVTVPLLNDKESPDAYEQRTWQNRLHVNQDGQCFVPPLTVKNALASAAKYLSIKIPGEGQAKYTKNFESGIMVLSPVLLFKRQEVQENGKAKLNKDGEKVYEAVPILADHVPAESYMVPSDGKKGGTKRVRKFFPVIYNWHCEAEVTVIDDKIPDEVFGRVFAECGKFNGWGRFRPQTGGYYGRFTVTELSVMSV